jgi:two-component system CheB/CheR fusion protein
MAKLAAPRKANSKKPTTKLSKVKRSKPYPIVAIGASAGGIEAVSDLLKNLTPTTGMAFVYLQHLDPTHESLLPNTLARFTKMKVVEAKNMIRIEPNKLFVLPPNKEMTLNDGVLKLVPRPAKPIIHMPINQFFSSLAEKQKDGAIGIVLSGNANDGSAGLRAIKNAGGITFAQDDSAKFQSMPKSAIAEGVVDRILSPAEIARELERISKNKRLLQLSVIAVPETEDDKDSSGDLDNILYLIKKSTGLDFSLYKKNTIKRRVIRRMLLYQHENLHQYLLYLKQHANEVNLLYNDLLINVTSFFRDPETTEYLQKTLLPKLLKTKSPNDPIRVWVPACSTGEEAYSMAMLIMESLGDKSNISAVQIFATDLSEQAINKARSGIYSNSDVNYISPKRLQRFFTKVDGSLSYFKTNPRSLRICSA